MKSIVRATLILAGLIFSWSETFSQGKFAVSATVAPFYGHTSSTVAVTVPDPNGSGTIISQELKSESSPKGYWIGLNGRYSFSQKWSALTGLWFGYFRLKTSTSDSRSHHFSIPIIANLQTSERKLSPANFHLCHPAVRP